MRKPDWMLTRQKIIIDLLYKADTKATRIELTKWAFLLGQDYIGQTLPSFYQFLPYNHGPYSFQMWREIDSLLRDGLVAYDGPDEVRLLGQALASCRGLDRRLLPHIDRFWADYGTLAEGELVDAVYARFPWFASRSKRVSSKALPLRAEPAVYTAGCAGYQIDGFLNNLLQSGIHEVIDVRYNAFSRHYGFHGSTLSRLCGNVGLTYQHVPQLGIPSDWRANVCSKKEFDQLAAKYESERLPSQADRIGQLVSCLKLRPSVLVCQEADPLMCHRARLAAEISRLSGLSVVHL